MARKKYQKSFFVLFFLFLSLVLIGWLAHSQEKQKQEIIQKDRVVKPPDMRIIAPLIVEFAETFVTNPSVGALPTEFQMKGSFFGDSQGSRVISLAGAKIGSEAIYDWTNTRVMFPVYGGHASIPSLNRGQHYKIWIENGSDTRISNEYDYLHTMKWDDIYPDSGPEGRRVTLKTYENYPFFSPTQGTFKVMFNTWEATVIKWGSDQIRVIVPDIVFPSPAKSLKVEVFIASAFGECVSTKRDFTVFRGKHFK